MPGDDHDDSKNPAEPSYFMQRLEELRQLLPSIGSPGQCREEIDLDGL